MSPNGWLFVTWLIITLIFTSSAIRAFGSWSHLRDTMILFQAISASTLAITTASYALIRTSLLSVDMAVACVGVGRVLIATSAIFGLLAIDTYAASNNGHRAAIDRWREPLERYFRKVAVPWNENH